jgi:hypothetical protein
MMFERQFQLPPFATPLFPNALPWSDRHVRRVFIVGAGFSKSLYDGMPLASELVNELKKRDLGNAIVTGSLETSLAFLAESHPFDRGPEPYERQALLAKVLQAIAEVIAEKSELGMATLPSWFNDLKLAWVRTSARVVSFNYDLLIESTPQNFNERVDLHKPHGSLNLCWRSNSPSSIERCYGSLERIKSNFENGRVPFVVPPTTSKSSYYHVDALALPWHVFRQSLETADEVVLLGFSMAEADATVTGLMACAVEKSIVVVDCSDDSISAIEKRLKLVGLSMKLGVVGIQSYVQNTLIPEIINRSFDVTKASSHLRNQPNLTILESIDLNVPRTVQTRRDGLSKKISSLSSKGGSVLTIEGGDGKSSITDICKIAINSKRVNSPNGKLILDWELTSSPSGVINLL